jgi:hypothetical protein
MKISSHVFNEYIHILQKKLKYKLFLKVGYIFLIKKNLN